MRNGGYVALALLVLVAGCAPGYSVETVTESASAVSLEYSYTVGGEYKATVLKAEELCQRYGKHARVLSQPVILDVDRAIAHFACER